MEGKGWGWGGLMADSSREHSNLQIREARRLGMIQWTSTELLVPLLMK